MRAPMQDYPAAHSMDSTWFAVDADGEVAVFDTGEGGCAPAEGFPMGGEAGGMADPALEENELLAYALHARARIDERLRALLPADPEELAGVIAHSPAWDVMQPLLRAAGVWTYACSESVATPYLREGEPAQAVRVDDLGAQLQRRFARARLPIRFREAPAIAPGEHVPVHAWGPLWVDLEGRPHPTADGGDVDRDEAAEIAAWAQEWRCEAQPGETLEGESFYDAVAKLIAEGTAARPPQRAGRREGGSPESGSGAGRGLFAGLRRWLRGG